MDLDVYKFFNPELCYMSDDELKKHYSEFGCHENRICNFQQLCSDVKLLHNSVDGYDFDWVYYMVHNNLTNIFSEIDAINHYIKFGFINGYYANEHQEKIETSPVGVNFFGYGATIIGQGVSANAIIETLKLINIPIIVNNINCKIQSSLLNKNDYKNPYKINIIHINPDRADIYLVIKSFMKNRINIGIWTWETEDIPKFWEPWINIFDEIWTISDYTLNAIAKSSLKPVINIKPPIKIEYEDTGFGQKFIQDNNIQDKFIFMYAFDFISYIERKNPYALIEALKRINDDRTVLILKTMNMPQHIERSFSGINNVIILNSSIKLDDYFSLLNCIHSYVSPHRSEGQGRTIMEAMYFGKKIIATGYSGNLDFCNVNTSYLIKWKYIKATNSGIYKGHEWADPIIAHLVKLMKRAVHDFYSGLNSMNIAAREIMLTNFSYQKCAELLKKRVDFY